MIELGLRIGEVLALRLEDCPARIRPTFKIIRIEEREGSRDPRSKRPARPKTLGRELSPSFQTACSTQLWGSTRARTDMAGKPLKSLEGAFAKEPVI